MTNEFQQRAAELIAAGKSLYKLGMVPATSGNFSARLADGSIAITVSGRHKGKLTPADIMRVDGEGRPLEDKKPSDETLLHCQIYQHFPTANAVLHPHSVNATLLSRRHDRVILLQDYELLKAFPGINSHEAMIKVPIFANDQNITRLATAIADTLSDAHEIFGYLIAGHGFYTWGNTLEDCLRHVEAFEFLFECEMRRPRNT